MNTKNILEYPKVIQRITEHMMSSDQFWYVLAYYRPLRAIMHITTLHYLEIDEPGMKLDTLSRKLVKEYSSGSDDFIVFPSFKDAERAALVNEFITQLPEERRKYFMSQWENSQKDVLGNWRPTAFYNFFSYGPFDEFTAGKYFFQSGWNLLSNSLRTNKASTCTHLLIIL